MKLHWKNDELYIGNLYIGEVMRIVPERWRETYKKAYSDDPEYIRQNVESTIRHHERHEAKPWRGWLMTSSDGDEVGHWASKDQAMEFLENLARIECL